MSDVVLRCPHCGTTQATAGECEACHEAAVRYFCPNHPAGRWLDAPACAECGARVGGGDGAEREARERAARERAARDRDARERAEHPHREQIRAVRERAERERAERERAERERAERERLHETRERAPAREPMRGEHGMPRPTPPVAMPPIGAALAPMVGCVGRLVLFAMVALVLLALGTCWVVGGSGDIRGWLTDTGQQMGLVEGVPEQTRRGIAAYQAGDLPLAQRELEEAARSYPRSGLALLYLSRMAIDAGDEPRGFAYLQEAVRREPQNAVAHRELAGVHFTRARRSRAAGDPEAVWRGELVSAEQHYARALAIDPSDRRARGYHGCVLSELGAGPIAERELADAGPGPWSDCGAQPTR